MMKKQNYRKNVSRKNTDKHNSDVEFVKELERNEGKTITRPLDKNQLKYLEKIGKEPHIDSVRIKTRQFNSACVNRLPNILRTIHFKRKKGQSHYTTKLDEKKREILDENEVEYYVTSYKIKL